MSTESTKLFVGSLDWGVTSEDLQEEFSKFGEIEEAIVIMDRDTGRSKGFGFVSFVNAEDATKAMEEMNEAKIKGRSIIVNRAHPKKS